MNPTSLQPAEQTCPNCGTLIDCRLDFCSNCGAVISAPRKGCWLEVIQFVSGLLALGFGLSGACFVGFGAFGFDNRDIGFPPSAPMVLGGLLLLTAAAFCIYAVLRINRRIP
ncbi:hypothetical protein B1R32_10411 [Abditibacterium utsteinense]|uniref:Zinc-ribbon domain-containing protein n=1 Tax=Abditibacterium utsteinense TaxID=1960156 RepID=A0A2S8SUP7_9BACT|nr:hypothetical protein [Abditibacterium utsteinense]PQV64518.1 hypothetical protein B1R32_10411 [Abditibacterium utsteinense]